LIPKIKQYLLPWNQIISCTVDFMVRNKGCKAHDIAVVT